MVEIAFILRQVSHFVLYNLHRVPETSCSFFLSFVLSSIINWFHRSEFAQKTQINKFSFAKQISKVVLANERWSRRTKEECKVKERIQTATWRVMNNKIWKTVETRRLIASWYCVTHCELRTNLTEIANLNRYPPESCPRKFERRNNFLMFKHFSNHSNASWHVNWHEHILISQWTQTNRSFKSFDI